MKKITSLLLSIICVLSLLAGCEKKTDESKIITTSPETVCYQPDLRIVTTVFPVYDWVRQILGDRLQDTELTLLLKNGVDLHSYQPTTDDLVAISNADIFIYVGGHSDTWVEDALRNEGNPNRIEIDLFDVLGDSLKPLVVTEGMEHHHDHHHEHDDDEQCHEHCDASAEDPSHDHHEEHDDHHDGHDEHHDHHEEHHEHHEEHPHEENCHEHHHDHDSEKDEHVWLSLVRAKQSVTAIAKEIAQADPDHRQEYFNNADQYAAQLEDLHRQYAKTVSDSRLDTLIFADRFPFFYLADDYGLKYYAAFTGCSAESEASFETVALLAEKLDTLQISSLLTIENRSHRIPETVLDTCKNKDIAVLVLNSLQSVTAEDLGNGITYLNTMENNLTVLREALS